jgi:hypothetical protein
VLNPRGRSLGLFLCGDLLDRHGDRGELPSRAVVGFELFAYDECWRYPSLCSNTSEVGLKCHKIAELRIRFPW